MPTLYTYPQAPAFDPVKNVLAKRAAFRVYARTDTTRATPLPVYADRAGTQVIDLQSDGLGLLPDFFTSAEQIVAVSAPYETPASSVEYLRGDPPSNYDLAVQDGYTGSLTDWLASLKGDKGDQGPAGGAGAAGGVPRVASYLVREEKLAKWRTALAAVTSAQTNVVVFGDSISEGTGTTNVANRWQTLLQRGLRYRNSGGTGAEFPFIPTMPVTSAPGFPVTTTGGATRNNTSGLGWKTGSLPIGATATFTFTGTSFKVSYASLSSTGVMSITIDGGTSTLLDTNSSVNGGGLSKLWASADLTPGPHTVKITNDASTPTGRVLWVHGLFTFNGDEGRGLRVLDAAYHGMQSAFFTATRNDAAATNLAVGGPVGLVLLNVGTNDYGAGTSPDVYKTNVAAFVTRLRQVYTGTIVLMNAYKGSGRDEALWAAYGDKLNEIAASDPDIAYFDWRLRMPDDPTPYNHPAGLNLYADTLHPSDGGNAWIASFLTDYLSLRA